MQPSLKALNYCNVNSFTYAERLELQQGNGGTYQVQMVQNGQRYLAAVGATFQITFPRALSITATPTNQDVVVVATVVDARDQSILQFTLSAAQVDKIVSGGVKLSITESGVTKTYPVDNFVARRPNTPGS